MYLESGGRASKEGVRCTVVGMADEGDTFEEGLCGLRGWGGI